MKYKLTAIVFFGATQVEASTESFYDPNGLALEFKAFREDSMIFEKE